MRRINFLALFLLLLLLCCRRSGDQTPQNYSLTVDPVKLVFSGAGGSQNVQVATDAPSWNAEASDGWIKVSTSGNTLSVQVEANPEKASRNGSIRVTAGATTADLTVMQSGKQNRPADDPYPKANYGLDDDAIFVKKAYTEGITSADPEQNTFTVPSSAVGAQKPEVGQKLIMNTPSSLFPDGLLAEVKSVRESGGNYEVSYTPLALEEAFAELFIEATDLDIGGALRKVVDPDGNEVPFTKTKASDQSNFHIEIPAASWPTGLIEGLEITPIMETDLTMTFQAIVANAKLYTFNASVKADMTVGGTISIGMEGKAVDERRPLFAMFFAAVPVGPVLVTPFIQLEAVYYVSGKVSIEATAKFHTVQRQGVHYDDVGGWGCLDYSKANENGEWTERSLSPKVEGSIAYGLGLGPYFGVYGKVVAAGISVDVLLKETVSEAFNLLDGDPSRYLSMDYVEHLQNAEYTYSTVTRAVFSVELVNVKGTSFDLPEVTISSNTMKIIPSVDKETFQFNRTDDGMELTIDIFNKHLLGGSLYALMKEHDGTPDSEARKVYFKDAGTWLDKLNAQGKGEDQKFPVTAFVPLAEEDSDLLYADIMYQTDVIEDPLCLASLTLSYDDAEAKAALMKILQDIYNGREGSWEGCNWFNTNQDVNTMKNVKASFRGGAFRYAITIPSDWKMGKNVTVGNYSQNAANFGSWTLAFENGSDAALEGFSVKDAHFSGVQLGGQRVTSFTVNSPIWDQVSQIPSTVTWLDLSKTAVVEIESAKVSETITSLYLEECSKLKRVVLGPSGDKVAAVDYSVKGSSALENILLQNMVFPKTFFYLNDRGTPTAEITLRSCTLEDNEFPGNFTSLSLNNCAFATITVSGNKTLERVDLRGSKGTGVVVKDCPKMGSLLCPDTGISTFEVMNLPEMVHLSVENNKNLKCLVPEVFDSIKERGGSVDYDIRYSYTDSGTGSVEYEDNGYGFWYEGEPECGYHGKEAPDTPDYATNPKDTKAQANFRRILKDLYDCRKNDWSGCNWGDVSVAIADMVNVKHDASTTGSNPYESLEITIPSGWELSPDVLVRRHFGMEGVTTGYGNSGHSDYWFLRIEGDRTFNIFQINDPRLAKIFVRGEAKTFAMHSPYFTFEFSNGVVRRDDIEIPAKIKTLDLTGCDFNRIFYETDAAHMPEKVILDLPYFSWGGSQFVFECKDSAPCKAPYIEVKNTAKRGSPYYVIYLTNLILPDGDVNFIKSIPYTGDSSFDTRVEAENCRATDFMVPDIGYIILSGDFGRVRASGLEHLNNLRVYPSESVIVESCSNLEFLNLYANEPVSSGSDVNIRNCEKLRTIEGYNSGYKELRVQNVPSLRTLDWHNTSLSSLIIDNLPSTAEVTIDENKKLTGVMQNWMSTVKKCYYDIRYDYSYGSGPYTTAKGTKFNYTDKGYGFYYSDEPQRGYHKDPR